MAPRSSEQPHRVSGDQDETLWDISLIPEPAASILRKLAEASKGVSRAREGIWGHSEKTSIQSRREASEETKTINTLTLDFRPPELICYDCALCGALFLAVLWQRACSVQHIYLILCSASGFNHWISNILHLSRRGAWLCKKGNSIFHFLDASWTRCPLGL